MVNKNELRIGNLVYSNNNGTGIRFPQTSVLFKILEIKAFSVSIIANSESPLKVEKWPEFRFEDIEPIPLTPEIVEKCGFQRIANTSWKILDRYLTFSFELSHVGDQVYRTENALTKHPIKYLHQLQNIYFALAGEELTSNYKCQIEL